jgi:hypothetical protein
MEISIDRSAGRGIEPIELNDGRELTSLSYSKG